jgi:hypothetical protein
MIPLQQVLSFCVMTESDQLEKRRASSIRGDGKFANHVPVMRTAPELRDQCFPNMAEQAGGQGQLLSVVLCVRTVVVQRQTSNLSPHVTRERERY